MMNKRMLLSVTALVCALTASSQGNKKEDIKAIKSMCGCYEVEFNFTETFEYAKDSAGYQKSPTKHEHALEWVELLEDTPNKLVLQHLLIVGEGPDDIVKHWRQDWIYENTELLAYDKGQTWKYKKLNAKDVKGQWTQKVYQVDDSPRYEGTATWAYTDGVTSWTNITDAPLPRREHTIRKDYNVLKRRNIHAITPYGWSHEQDNDKLVRDDSGNDVVLAQEKGLDKYKKVADSKCIIAQNWWAKNKDLWKKVRTKWQTVADRDKDIVLNAKVGNKTLYSHLFALKPDATQAEVDTIIDSFIVNK